VTKPLIVKRSKFVTVDGVEHESYAAARKHAAAAIFIDWMKRFNLSVIAIDSGEITIEQITKEILAEWHVTRRRTRPG